MALIAVNAVVDIARHVIMLEIVWVVIPVASGALKHRIVIRVDMARRTHVVGIAMARRELRVLGVVEAGVRPTRCVVAVLARRWEKLLLRLVPRIRGVLIIRLMTAIAIRRQGGVVVVDVAIHTMPRWRLVRTGEWECGVVVVERRIRPIHRVMAKFTGRRKAGGRVRRIIRIGVVRLVARIAERAIQVVVVVLMAIRTLPRWNRVRSRQLKPRTRVIESRIRPLHRVMARITGSREIRCNVVYRR